MSVVYQIQGWRSTFENNKSRERERCGYVCIPNKQDGLGLANILSLPDGPAIYGIFQLMLGAASRQGRHRDGWLTADGHRTGTPWAPSDMAVLWRCQETLITRAIEVLTSPRVGWLLAVDVPDFTETRTPDGHHAGTACPVGALEEKRSEEKSTPPPPREAEEVSRVESGEPAPTPPDSVPLVARGQMPEWFTRELAEVWTDWLDHLAEKDARPTRRTILTWHLEIQRLGIPKAIELLRFSISKGAKSPCWDGPFRGNGTGTGKESRQAPAMPKASAAGPKKPSKLFPDGAPAGVNVNQW